MPLDIKGNESRATKRERRNRALRKERRRENRVIQQLTNVELAMACALAQEWGI